MIPEGFRVERAGGGELLNCWHQETSYQRSDLTLNTKYRWLDLEHHDSDGENANVMLDLDVILNLLRRAGFVVQEPEGKQ